LALRELVLQVAATTEGVGELEESLKWGEPAYQKQQEQQYGSDGIVASLTHHLKKRSAV
jgi:hypothetical protein